MIKHNNEQWSDSNLQIVVPFLFMGR